MGKRERGSEEGLSKEGAQSRLEYNELDDVVCVRDGERTREGV